MSKRVYLIGSLRNPLVPELGALLRSKGFDVFDCWHAAGPEADDYWQRYTAARGQTYDEALRDYPAQHVFQYDKRHLTASDIAVLVMPAGKSAHLELGFFIGRREALGLPTNGVIYLPDPPDRYDAMYAFASKVCVGLDELLTTVRGY